MTPEQKAVIDNSPYQTLLRKWRFAEIGDPMFQGDTGEYYETVMFQKRAADPAGAVQASNNVGWKK